MRPGGGWTDFGAVASHAVLRAFRAGVSSLPKSSKTTPRSHRLAGERWYLIWRTLADLKREGLAQIVIDKNVARLLPLADRHYVLEKGRVVWQGDSQSLRGRPEIVQQYLGV